jgi:GDPmannose 4,6-dehydratase
MWLMLQQEKPGDYVVASGQTRSIRDFCQAAFAIVGLNWQDHVVTRSDFLRPAEVDVLCGDATKAREVLRWGMTISFDDMVAEMVEADLRRHSKKSR